MTIRGYWICFREVAQQWLCVARSGSRCLFCGVFERRVARRFVFAFVACHKQYSRLARLMFWRSIQHQLGYSHCRFCCQWHSAFAGLLTTSGSAYHWPVLHSVGTAAATATAANATTIEERAPRIAPLVLALCLGLRRGWRHSSSPAHRISSDDATSRTKQSWNCSRVNRTWNTDGAIKKKKTLFLSALISIKTFQ